MLNNWFYIMPLVTVMILFISAKKKSKLYVNGLEGICIIRNYLPMLVLGLYLLSAFLVFFARPEEWYPYFDKSSYTPLNFTFYSIFVFIYLVPVLYFRPLSVRERLPSPTQMNPILIIMSLLGWFSFLYQLPYAIKAYSIGVESLRLEMNLDNVFVLPNNLLTTIAVGVSAFYLFFILFFFISIVQKRSLFIKLSMIIGSLSYVINGVTFMTRDVFIFYPIGFLFVFLFLASFLNEKLIQKVKRRFFLLSVLAIVSLLSISFSRFSNSSRDELAYGTIGYLAQQPFVFSETIEKQSQFYKGHLRFPVFTQLFDEKREVERAQPYEWSFGTMVKDLYSEGGLFFLVGFTMVFISLFIYRLKWIFKINFYQKVIVTLFYFQFITEGLFYFKLGSRAGNLYIIILCLLYILSGAYYKKVVKQ